MKKILFQLLSIFILIGSVTAQVGIGTSTPDSSAMLEISSANKGLLPPRVALIATNLASPVTNPATFLLVCNTATSGIAPYNVEPGYYYWNVTSWVPVVNKGQNVGDMQYWNGAQWVMVPAGKNDDVLTWCNGAPTWGGCTKTVTLQPGPEGFDACLDYKPSCNGGNATGADYPETLISVWTYDGIGCGTGTLRYIVKFAELDSIPSNALILSAKLSFYGVSSSTISPQGNSSYPGSPYNQYGTNGVLVQRVTGPWDESTITWNTQPASTTTNQVTISPSTSRWSYDAPDLDVTAMVQDMRASANYGFILKLQTEAIYRNMNFASGDATNPAMRPRLVIIYRPQ